MGGGRSRPAQDCYSRVSPGPVTARPEQEQQAGPATRPPRAKHPVTGSDPAVQAVQLKQGGASVK